MKIRIFGVLTVACMVIVAQGCSDGKSDYTSDDEGGKVELIEQLENEKTKNEELKVEIEKLQEKNNEYSRKMYYLELKLKSQNYILKEVVQFMINRQDLPSHLLKFLGLNDIPNPRDPYINLCNLELWHDKDISWSIFDYFLKKMDRKKENMEILFQRYKNEIFNAMDNDIYVNSQAEAYVEILLCAYKNITTGTNHVNFLEQAPEEQRTVDPQSDNREEFVRDYERQFGALSDDLKIFKNTRSGYILKIKYWAYSFWTRRQIEGNSKIIAKILTEIQSHYSESTTDPKK